MLELVDHLQADEANYRESSSAVDRLTRSSHTTVLYEPPR